MHVLLKRAKDRTIVSRSNSDVRLVCFLTSRSASRYIASVRLNDIRDESFLSPFLLPFSLPPAHRALFLNLTGTQMHCNGGRGGGGSAATPPGSNQGTVPTKDSCKHGTHCHPTACTAHGAAHCLANDGAVGSVGSVGSVLVLRRLNSLAAQGKGKRKILLLLRCATTSRWTR